MPLAQLFTIVCRDVASAGTDNVKLYEVYSPRFKALHLGWNVCGSRWFGKVDPVAVAPCATSLGRVRDITNMKIGPEMIGFSRESLSLMPGLR